jgi:hypothetical protein
MKHFAGSLGCVITLGCLASAADQTWTGQISDSMCGVSHSEMIARKQKDLQTSSGAPAKDCTLACIKDGGKYVFVVNGQVYKITNQNLSALQAHAGENVVVTGDIKGDMITVSSVAMPAKK